MRLLAFLEYAAVAIGLLGIAGGHHFHLRDAFNLGVLLVGIGIALGGLEGVLTRRMPFRFSDDAYERSAGVPAFLVALIALIVGAAFIASAYLLEQYLWHATVLRLERDAGELWRRLEWPF